MYVRDHNSKVSSVNLHACAGPSSAFLLIVRFGYCTNACNLNFRLCETIDIDRSTNCHVKPHNRFMYNHNKINVSNFAVQRSFPYFSHCMQLVDL